MVPTSNQNLLHPRTILSWQLSRFKSIPISYNSVSCTLKCCKPAITVSHNSAVRLNPSLLPHQTFLPICMIFNYIVYIGAIDTTQARQITTDTSGKSSPSHVSVGLQNISTYILSEQSMAAIRYIILVSFLFYFCAVPDCNKYWYHCE